MYRRTALTAAVSLVAVSAGCTGSEDEQPSDSEPEDADDNQTDDAESVNETEEELTLETFEYPESVDQDGFRRNLASVHADRLAAAGSFRVTREVERSAKFDSTRTTTVAVDGDTLLLSHDDGFRTREIWSDQATHGGDVLIRDSNDFGERYRVGEQSRTAEDVDGSETLAALIDAAMFDASDLETDDDTPVVVFESADVIDPSAFESVQHMDRYDELEASIDVSEAGVVGYQYELTGEGYHGSTVITESATFEDVGETNLDEPEWVDEGWDRALELSIEPTADGSSFVVTIERGEPIPAGAQIDLYAGRQLSGSLDQEITREDTLYLYADGEGKLGVSLNNEPNPNSSIDARFADLSIRTENGLTVYAGNYDGTE